VARQFAPPLSGGASGLGAGDCIIVGGVFEIRVVAIMELIR
jgi:hypothetical protein